MRSIIEPDLFDNNVTFDNTTPIYLINLLWKLALGLGLDLELHCFILLLIVWVRSFSKMLPYVEFAEDKVLVFVILREKMRK